MLLTGAAMMRTVDSRQLQTSSDAVADGAFTEITV